MKFGAMDHLDIRPDVPLATHYADRLSLISAYERAGFTSYHVAEHHCTPLGGATSPNLFLSAVAQRTRRLRFGPLVYALPLHHPLRLAEEICMLDQMSGGRLDLGFGRGSVPMELSHYGQDPENARQVYDEAREVVLQALTEGRVNFHGSCFDFDDVPIILRPLQRPHPPIWYGVHSLESAEKAARTGLNIVCNEPSDTVSDFVARFRSVWEECRGADPVPHIAITRFMVLAPTDEEAMAIADRAYKAYLDSFLFLFRRHGRRPRISGGEANFAELAAVGRAVAGTPEKVARFLEADLRKAGANYFLTRFAFGDLTLSESMRSLDLFVEHVLPQLGKPLDAPAVPGE